MIDDLLDNQQKYIQLRNIVSDKDEDINDIQAFDVKSVLIEPIKEDNAQLNYDFEIQESRTESFIPTLLSIFFSNMLIYFFPPITLVFNLIFLGIANQNSYEVLEAFGASNLYISIFIFSIIIGLNVPFETQGGGYFGNNKVRVFGKVYVLASIITVSISIILYIPSIFVGKLLLDIFISTTTTKTLLDSFFVLYLTAGFIEANCLPNMKYLIITKKIIPIIILNSLTLIIHIVCNYIFVVASNMSLQGTAISNLLSYSFLYISSTIYIRVIKPYPESLVALNRKDFEYLWDYLTSSLLSMLLVFLSTFAYEVVSVFLLTKYESDFSAYITLSSISSLILIFALCLENSITLVISEYYDIMSKQTLFNKIISVGMIIGNMFVIIAIIILIILRFTLSDFFNVNSSVFAIMLKDFWWFIIYLFLQFNVNILQGVFRGINRIIFPSVLSLIIIIVVNIPVSYVLAIFLDWKSEGTWIAFDGSSFLNYIILMLTFVVIYNNDEHFKNN